MSDGIVLPGRSDLPWSCALPDSFGTQKGAEGDEMVKAAAFRLVSRWLLQVLLLSVGARAVQAQTQDTDTESATLPLDYRFPTDRHRVRDFLQDTLGSGALAKSAFAAGADHFANDPPEWRQGTKAYSRRLASRFGRLAIQNSVELGLGVVLHKDMKYRRCDCEGFLRRTSHALVSSFTVGTRNGGRILLPAKIASQYAGAIISTAWYPDRYTAGGDGVRAGTLSVASTIGLNVLREFWPDIRRFFRR